MTATWRWSEVVGRKPIIAMDVAHAECICGEEVCISKGAPDTAGEPSVPMLGVCEVCRRRHRVRVIHEIQDAAPRQDAM